MIDFPISQYEYVGFLGIDRIVEQIGLVQTILLAVVVIIITAGILGGRKWIKRAREASEQQIAENLRGKIDEEDSTEDIHKTITEEENDVLSEATRRIQQEGEEITGEKLKQKLTEIEEETAKKEVPTGMIEDRADKAPIARMNVAPEELKEQQDHLEIRGKHGEKFYSRNMMVLPYPNRVSYGWLDKLFTGGLETDGADVRTAYHIWPRDNDRMMDELNKRATRLTSRVRKKQREGKIDTIDEEQKRDEINSLRDRLNKGETEIFDFAIYVQVVADTEDALNDGTQEVNNMFRQNNARLVPIHDRQLEAFRSGAPLAQDFVRQTQIMDTQSLATTFPFIEPTRTSPNGVLFGFHYTTNAPVLIDRFDLSGHNCLITGKIGGGKSYMAKLLMWRRLMMDPETELMIIDPVGGFGEMVKSLGGQVITVDKDTIINPLEIREARTDSGEMEEDPYDIKIRSVMGMFRQHFSTLEKREEGVLRRAIKYAYLQKGITKDPRTHSRESPTIQDIIDILTKWSHGNQPKEFLDVSEDLMKFVDFVDTKRQQDTESNQRKRSQEREAEFAHDVLLGLEEFRPGGQRDNLNGQTNIDMDARVVQFDLSNVVDANNAGLIMHIMLDYLFQRAKSTRNRSLITIDEVHYMLKDEGATNVLNTFVRHSRHYNSGVTLISQTIDEFMEDKRKEIYDQCDIRILMRHEDISDEAMESLNLRGPERSFVLNAQAGNTSDHSECLLLTSDGESKRLRVYANEFEHHVVDEDAPIDVWTLLYKRGIVTWENIPPHKQPVVRNEINGSPNQAQAD